MKIASPYSIVKWIFLLLILSQFIECKRSGDGCADKIIDSTHFDSSEKAKIPDWLGDSLFFYSDAGDTAYMVCNVQYFHYTDGDFNEGSGGECPRNLFYYYPEYYYGYTSNHKDLDNIHVIIYKESNLSQIIPGQPVSRIGVDPKIGGFLFSDFGSDSFINDSVVLQNSEKVYGIFNGGKDVSMNLKIGIIKLNTKSGNSWQIFKHN